METKVRCIQTYNDSEIKERITNNPEDDNYERIVTKERAIELVKAGVCVLVDEQEQQDGPEQQDEQEQQDGPEQHVETAKLEPDTETAVQKSKTSNKKTK